MAAYQREGLNPTHVARFYDGCGYDIELPTCPIQRIEVKAASTNTQGQFILTRNEYDKSLVYGSEWCVVQVVFSPEAFFADKVTSAHIVKILAISADPIRHIAPFSSIEFRWLESAQFNLPLENWRPVTVQLDPNFSVNGFRTPQGQS